MTISSKEPHKVAHPYPKPEVPIDLEKQREDALSSKDNELAKNEDSTYSTYSTSDALSEMQRNSSYKQAYQTQEIIDSIQTFKDVHTNTPQYKENAINTYKAMDELR